MFWGVWGVVGAVREQRRAVRSLCAVAHALLRLMTPGEDEPQRAATVEAVRGSWRPAGRRAGAASRLQVAVRAVEAAIATEVLAMNAVASPPVPAII